jgi:signal transduction histidine kinase
MNIGACYTKLKKHKSAIAYLKKAMQIAKETGDKMHEAWCYQALSESYEEQGNYKTALDYYRNYRSGEKEIFNSEKSKQIAEMTAKYETEKKKKEAEIQRLKNVELRKEIRKRTKVEKQLKEHRDQLEKIVAKRTAKLKATNITLKKEIATRRRAEKELLNYQKQLRSLAHELSLVEERQRRKIATNLHDSISQSLMIVKSSLEMLASTASSKNTRKKLKEIQSHVTQMIQRTRSMTFEISPPVLYELGLEPAMEWLAEGFQEQHGISCEFHDDGVSKPMSTDWRCILFQSTRELLANIRKHAKANKVLISTRREGRLIRITVEDDGIGFDPKVLNQKIRKNEGFGLFNLRERLTHLKGSVEIDSEKGKGTTVTLLAPLKRGRRATPRMRA